MATKGQARQYLSCGVGHTAVTLGMTDPATEGGLIEAGLSVLPLFHRGEPMSEAFVAGAWNTLS